jgi:peptidoglycan/LPS O-acetylase OafA/YrhL
LGTFKVIQDLSVKQKYRPDIDGLRAIAVAGVLCSHFGIRHLTGGYAGVDVFFVISGYLITQLILSEINAGNFSFRAFYIRRARRLFPALFFTLLTSLLAAAVLFAPERMRDFGLSLVAAALSFSNVLFWSQRGYFDAASTLKPLLHTWSLSVEEQFYMVWPLALLVLSRRGMSIPLALLAVFVVSLAANYAWQDHTSSIFYLLPFRAFEFAIGGAVVFLQRRSLSGNLAHEAMLTAGLGMIVLSYVVFTAATPFPSFPALVPCVGTALAILGGSARFSGLLLRNPVSVAVGVRSYSLYLAHWPIIVFYEYSVSEPMDARASWALIALTLVIASAMYSTIERPFRVRQGDTFRYMPVTFVPTALSLTVVMVAANLNAWSSNGWIWRLGDRAALFQNLGDGKTAFSESIYGGSGCGNRCDTNPGQPVAIYVIGDSHAQQYYRGFEAEFPSLNTRTIQFSSCPFFSYEFTRDFSDNAEPKLYDDGCRAARREVFREIKGTSATVIISQFWVNFPLISEATGQKFLAGDLKEALAFTARQLVILKHELGIEKLFIVGSVPTMIGWDNPLDCLARPITSPPNCIDAPLRDATISGRSGINDTLMSETRGALDFLNPFESLCDDVSCKMVVAGKPVYCDPTHLSVWGSQIVVHSFRNQLSVALQAQPVQAIRDRK